MALKGARVRTAADEMMTRVQELMGAGGIDRVQRYPMRSERR